MKIALAGYPPNGGTRSSVLTSRTTAALFLEIPFTDSRELLMDILKYGRDVEVVSPKELRERVADEARGLADFYSKR
jgi:predicted DNA-binding transcriptional regulator YafY